LLTKTARRHEPDGDCAQFLLAAHAAVDQADRDGYTSS
jgi:hypothetical protein